MALRKRLSFCSCYYSLTVFLLCVSAVGGQNYCQESHCRLLGPDQASCGQRYQQQLDGLTNTQQDCSAPDVTDSYCNECPSPPPTAAWLPGLSATISAIDDDVMNITFAWDTNTDDTTTGLLLHIVKLRNNNETNRSCDVILDDRAVQHTLVVEYFMDSTEAGEAYEFLQVKLVRLPWCCGMGYSDSLAIKIPHQCQDIRPRSIEVVQQNHCTNESDGTMQAFIAWDFSNTLHQPFMGITDVNLYKAEECGESSVYAVLEVAGKNVTLINLERNSPYCLELKYYDCQNCEYGRGTKTEVTIGPNPDAMCGSLPPLNVSSSPTLAQTSSIPLSPATQSQSTSTANTSPPHTATLATSPAPSITHSGKPPADATSPPYGNTASSSLPLPTPVPTVTSNSSAPLNPGLLASILITAAISLAVLIVLIILIFKKYWKRRDNDPSPPPPLRIPYIMALQPVRVLVLFSPRSPGDAIIRDHLIFKLKDITGESRRISDVSFYQSTEVNDVHEWIEYSVKTFDKILLVCNRQFQEEWNNRGSHINEEPIIHYLRYSYMWELRKHTTQYMKSKYAVVLMQESHRQYIPDCYSLSLKVYQFSQIEEIASHILEQPLYRFPRDMQMPCTSV